MPIVLPDLPYSLSALEPYFSKETLEFHYGKHHQAYVTQLNALIQDIPSLRDASIEHIILNPGENKAIYNNAAQIWNHTFFWNSLSPKGGGKPTGKLLDLIERDFGSFDGFKEQFSNAGKSLFGSGWVFLVQDAHGKLSLRQESNAGTPMTSGLRAILTCDVWEHAYYIDYRNQRVKYLEVFWNLVNWSFGTANLM
jgi:Fe-Mn family superoxide dismutase